MVICWGEWILGVFMHFDECPDAFLMALFSTLLPFGLFLGHCCPRKGQFGALLATKMVSFRGDYGLFWVILGSAWFTSG